MSARIAITLAAIGVLAIAQTARAQGDLALRGYIVVGSTWLTAADSFNAVADTNRTSNVGGGATLTFWKDAIVDVAVMRMKVEGQRVFVDQGTVYGLDIPLRVTMIPLDVAAGWRKRGRIAPYGAVGLSRISYSERSDFAADGDDVDDSGTGLLVLGGADVTISRLMHIGGEIRYRKVEGPLGQTGVSEIFGERSIGGFAASIRFSFGR